MSKVAMLQHIVMWLLLHAYSNLHSNLILLHVVIFFFRTYVPSTSKERQQTVRTRPMTASQIQAGTAAIARQEQKANQPKTVVPRVMKNPVVKVGLFPALLPKFAVCHNCLSNVIQ